MHTVVRKLMAPFFDGLGIRDQTLSGDVVLFKT
jgi:hypothetical protein